MLAFFLFCSFAKLLVVYGSFRWLSYENYPENTIWEKSEVCSKKYGLTEKQIQFCNNKFRWMQPIQDASKRSREECQFLLSDEKWNCHSVSKAPKFDNDLKHDTRQSAFIYALSAASLSISVARACMTGQIYDCSCYNPRRQSSFPSKVIDDNNLTFIDRLLPCQGVTNIGKDFTRQFIDLGFRSVPKNIGQSRKYTIKKHNIDVGLSEIGEKEEINCVCNGATAGCVMKFCHRYVVRFEEVAKRLVKKYHDAVQISIKDMAQKQTDDTYLVTEEFNNKLVFIKESEDFCSNKHISGRICVLDQSKVNNCEKLCCGRGFQEKVIEITSQCRCEFEYCCKVKCDTCRRAEKILECL